MSENNAAAGNKAEQPEDILQLYSEEAEAFLEATDLSTEVLVLEDWCGGSLISRVLLGGGPDEYLLSGRDFETGRAWEKTTDRSEASEMIAEWTVTERRDV